MVSQILLGMGFSAYTDLDPWECLRPHLCDDRLDAIVTAGRAICANPEPAGLQRDIVEQNDDPLRRNVEVCRELQNRSSGQVHIGLGLQKKHLFALIVCLRIQSLVF